MTDSLGDLLRRGADSVAVPSLDLGELVVEADRRRRRDVILMPLKRSHQGSPRSVTTNGPRSAARLVVRVRQSRREELLNTARAVRAEKSEADGWVRLEVTFEDLRHAVWAIWQLDTFAEVLAPDSLRDALHDRASELAARYHSGVRR